MLQIRLCARANTAVVGVAPTYVDEYRGSGCVRWDVCLISWSRFALFGVQTKDKNKTWHPGTRVQNGKKENYKKGRQGLRRELPEHRPGFSNGIHAEIPGHGCHWQRGFLASIFLWICATTAVQEQGRHRQTDARHANLIVMERGAGVSHRTLTRVRSAANSSLMTHPLFQPHGIRPTVRRAGCMYHGVTRGL